MATALEPVWEQWTRKTILPLVLLTVDDWWHLLAHRPYSVPIVGGLAQVTQVFGSVANGSTIVDWMAMKLGDEEGIAIAEFVDGTSAFYVLTLGATVQPTTPLGSVGAAFQMVYAVGGAIPPGSITTAQLADNSVTSAKIVDGTIQAIDIAPGAITTPLIATGAVTSNQLGVNSVQPFAIAPQAVTTGKIADYAVTAQQIAPGTITSAQIADGSIQAIDIAPQSIGTVQLTPGSVTTLILADGNVTTAKLADGAVTNQQLGIDSVTSWNIADGTIQSIDIGARQITTDLIADQAVGTAQITTAAVTTAQIANGSITDALVHDVSWSKITGAPAAGGPPSGAASGDLTGTYPAPTIAPGAVTTSKIANAPNGVTDAQISSVSWGKITGIPGGVTPIGPAGGDLTGNYPAPTIANGAVTALKIAANTIGTGHIVDLNVTDAKIAGVSWAKVTGAPTTLPPSGAAGGSLAGSYPNPQIAAGSVSRIMLDAPLSSSVPPQPTPADASLTLTVNPAGTGLIYTTAPPATLTPGQVTTTYLGAAPNGVATGNINDLSVSDAKISSVAYTKLIGAPASMPPSGNAGGDLAGTYPNPTVRSGLIPTTLPPSGAAGGGLAGTYPNPTLNPAALPWTPSQPTGGLLAPTDPSKTVQVPGNSTIGAVLQLGPATGTRLLRLTEHSNGVQGMLALNRNWMTGNTPDDTTGTGWGIRLASDVATDNCVIQRSPVGSSSPAQLLEVRGSDGKTYCTLADTSVTKTMLAVRAACNNFIQAAMPGVSPPATTGAWVKIFDIGTITSRGGLMLIFWFWNYAYVGNNSSNTVYVGFGRNGAGPAGGQYVRNDFAASGSALSRWPLQSPTFMEGPAAGTYTYSVYTYVANTNGSVNCPANDAPGVATVIELS